MADMGKFVKACKVGDVPAGKLKWVKVEGKDVLVANCDGSFYAIGYWCTHEQAGLAGGVLEGTIVTCPDHSAQFDVTSGRVLAGPDGDDPSTIPPEPAYKVKVEGDDILVEL